MHFAVQQPCLGCQSLGNGFHLIGEWLRKAFGYEAERRSSIPSEMDQIWSNRMDDVKTPPVDSPPNFGYKRPKTDVKDLNPKFMKNVSPNQAHGKNENIPSEQSQFCLDSSTTDDDIIMENENIQSKTEFSEINLHKNP